MKQNEDVFTKKMFKSLWIPAVISSLGWAFSDMADAIVVGQRLGATGLAAISLILPIYMINCVFAHGLGLGGSAKFSKLLGEGKEAEAIVNFNSITYLALAFSVLTAVLGNLCIVPLLGLLGTTPEDGMLFEATKDYLHILISATPFFYFSNILNYYLRNDQNQKLAVMGSMVGNLCDIGFNIILVLVADMGTRGAALSTLLGQIISIMIYLPGVTSKAHFIKLKRIKPAFTESIKCLTSGLSTSVQYLFQLVFFLIINNVLMSISGESGVAIFDVLQNTSYLILYLFEGTARGMQPILSTYNGEYNEKGKHNTLKLGFLGGMTLGGSFILLIIVFPQLMCLLFGIAGSSIEKMAWEALRIYCIGAVFAGGNILMCNYYQSCERDRAAYFIEVLRGIVLLLPFTLLFSLMGIHGVWWLFPATEVGTSVILLVCYKKGKILRPQFDRDRIYQCSTTGKSEEISALNNEVESFCEKWEASGSQQYFVTMTIEEICLAINSKGFSEGEGDYIQITLVAHTDGSFKIHIRYNAGTFNPFSLETSLVGYEDGFDEDAIGIMLIKKTAKEFYYRRYQGFNTLIVKI